MLPKYSCLVFHLSYFIISYVSMLIHRERHNPSTRMALKTFGNMWTCTIIMFLCVIGFWFLKSMSTCGRLLSEDILSNNILEPSFLWHHHRNYPLTEGNYCGKLKLDSSSW